jgi:hypothetical protein
VEQLPDETPGLALLGVEAVKLASFCQPMPVGHKGTSSTITLITLN